MPSRIYHWKPDWLEKGINGVSFRTWCRKVKGENTFVHCILCDSQFDIGSSGSWGLKSHALTKRHLNAVDRSNNRRAAVSGNSKTRDLQVSKDISAAQNNSADLSKTLHPLVINVFNQDCKTPTDVNRNWCSRKASGGDENKFIEVYICFYCAEEFPLRSSLHAHQLECVMRPPDLQAITPPSKAVQLRDPGDSPPCLAQSQSSLSPSMNLPKTAVRESVMEPSKDNFMSMIGLLPKTKAAQVCQKRRRRNTECETLDLDEEVIPMTPTLPRTPKCLLSHLSREGNDVSTTTSQSFSFRRQLSFHSQNHLNEEIEGKEAERDDDPQSSQKIAETKNMGKTKSLYNIDLSSLLGQVVNKHFKGDPSLHVLSDIESHCLTSTPKKSVLSSRPLRARHLTYHVTFKGYSMKRNIFCPEFFHEYKFTRKQKREFIKRVNSGLCKSSRALRRQMKPCSVELKYISKADLRKWIPSQNSLTVDLKPLTTAEIAYWTTSKSEPNLDNVAVFPEGLSFSSPNVENILGLRTRQKVAYVCVYKLPLSIANYVSEETFAEVTQNRKAVYKSLLSDSLLENNLADNESTPSILRKMLTSPVVGLNNVNDFRNLGKNHWICPGTYTTSSSGSPRSLTSETDQCRSASSRTSSIVDEFGSCSFLSNVNRDMSFSEDENFSQSFASRKLLKRKNETVSPASKRSSKILKPKHSIWLRLSNSGEKIKKREENSLDLKSRPKFSRKLLLDECYGNSLTHAVKSVGPPHKKLRTCEGQELDNCGALNEHESRNKIHATAQNLTTGQPRKRGRPRKASSNKKSVSVSRTEAQPNHSANEKIPRKVGRPRKYVDGVGTGKKTTNGLLKLENKIHEKKSKKARTEKGASAFARRLSAAGLVPRDMGEKQAEETSFSSSSSLSTSPSKCWGKNLFEQFSTLLHCSDDKLKDLNSTHQRETATRSQLDASKNFQVNNSEKKTSLCYSQKVTRMCLTSSKTRKTKSKESMCTSMYCLPRQVGLRKHRVRKIMSVLKQAEERKSVLTAFVDNFNSRKRGGSFHTSSHNLRGRKKAQKQESR